MTEAGSILGPDRDLAATAESNLSQPLFSARQWVRPAMFLYDVLMVEIVVGLGYLSRSLLAGWLPVDLIQPTYAGILFGVLALPVGYFAVGLHPGYGLGEVERLRRRVLVTVAVFVALLSWDYLGHRDQFSRGILVFCFVYALVLPWYGERLLRNFLAASGCWGEPVAVLGANAMGRKVAQSLRDRPEVGFVPVGFLDDDPPPIDTWNDDSPLLGFVGDARSLCPRVRSVIIALPDIDETRFHQLCERMPFTNIIFVSDFSDLCTIWVSPVDLGGIVALRVKENLLLRNNRVLKRVVDLVVGFALAVFTAPLIGLCALLIKLVDPGPAFYRQERTGKDGKPFKMIKLRTMYTGADQILQDYLEEDEAARVDWHHHMKLRNDPRVLPVIGNFLWKCSIDELPQLWHVLTGEMSVVGPRPFPDYHLALFSDEFRYQRSKVPPGLTGLWQVEARSDADLETQKALDTYYIKSWSLWMDLYVVMRTIPAVLSGRGAR